MIRVAAAVVLSGMSLSLFGRRVKADQTAWEAVVESKSRGMPSGSFMLYRVKVRQTDGSTVALKVHKNLWHSVNEGDTLIKQPGQLPVRKA